MIRGAFGRHLVRGVDRLLHHVEDVQAGVAGLLQRGGQDRGGDAVELGVELERGDELLGAGDLEVHVAEGVLGTEDVGEGDVVVLPSTSSEIRPMAIPATGAFSGTPAFSSDMVEAQTEPIDVEPLEPSASETWRIA